AARLLIVKIVNALSAMQQIGGPTACAYLLGNPDHYTDQVFKTFYWTSYVSYVQSTTVSVLEVSNEDTAEDQSERVLIGVERENVVPYYRVNDYIYRPMFYDSMCLYTYLATTVVKKSRTKSMPATDDMTNHTLAAGYVFQAQHPLSSSHAVHDVRDGTIFTLNFVGPTLPRRDVGSRETYCRAMLTFFKPGGWRRGDDLLAGHASWENAFNDVDFAPEHVQIMKNMNVLYECLDARDDYSALRRAQEADQSFGSFLSVTDNTADTFADDHVETIDNAINDDAMTSVLDDPSSPLGHYLAHLTDKMDAVGRVVRRLYGDSSLVTGYSSSVPELSHSTHMSAQVWNNVLQDARERAVQRRNEPSTSLLSVHDSRPDGSKPIGFEYDANCVFIATKSMFLTFMQRYNLYSPSCGLQDTTVSLMHHIAQEFTLNEEQLLAFGLVTGHLHRHDSTPLRMYIGGIGGTGKSTVIKSIMAFLRARGEANRFLVLAPTGTAACNIDGQTYHSALGI
ncbi:hypothetical protein FOMPIDRAFT_1085568, partial [Fomitopsis schrenkii]